MEIHGPEDLLKRIARVDPPPFLLTRIEARLAAAVQVPRGRSVAVACALAALLVVNAVVLGGEAVGSGQLDEVVDAMGMNASNQLYR